MAPAVSLLRGGILGLISLSVDASQVPQPALFANPSFFFMPCPAIWNLQLQEIQRLNSECQRDMMSPKDFQLLYFSYTGN